MSLNPADDEFAARLRAVLPEDAVRSAETRYLQEPRGRYFGAAGLLTLPRSAEEVSRIIRLANAHHVPVIPYGGGTGLVGGQVMERMSPVILSLERMTRIREIYSQENVLIAEAGAILADVQAAALDAGRLFPLSLAAEGSCRIGGNLATNAGGLNVLRYGNARDLCLGLEAVLPDGQIWHGLTRLRKDNTGYDLRNLLIGSEGTLGVITAAALKLFPVPATRGTAIFSVSSPDAALQLLSMARDQVGETVSGFELIHRQGLEFLSEVMPQVRQPFATPPEWSVLIELGMARGQDPEAELATLFETASNTGLVSDGVIAQSEAQRDELWTVRESIPEANRLIGSVSSHDISIPISEIPEFLSQGQAGLARLGEFRINAFGHLGDGNLHFNVFPAKGRERTDYDEVRLQVKKLVHDLVDHFNGSFSAEHGVGRMKAGDLELYADPVRLAAMKAIKGVLDPKGIMNPGAILKGPLAN
ncbi:MAG: FAD-binding protein [Rhodobacteraceae bacterium]|nr:FAD-binding protein [Paracoccaceae bacterium]